MTNIFQAKRILVTGGTGSIGSEIIRKLIQLDPMVVRVFSNDENSLFDLKQEIQNDPKLRFFIGDVRDKERVKRAMHDIDFAFHAAALKHVPFCEYNPFEAVLTNVLGTQNVLEAAIEAGVEKVITISTDKAVNPLNVMGATKLLAERLTITAKWHMDTRKTISSCVRFGNVLDSRGSVIPVFREQIRKGGPVTITDPSMTRFVMSIPKAVDLVLKAAKLAKVGEIFIIKMPVLRIGDLAEVMIEELAPLSGYNPQDVKINIIGKRAYEKSHEELLTEEESIYARETEDMLIIGPVEDNSEPNVTRRTRYISDDETPLSKKAIGQLLRDEMML